MPTTHEDGTLPGTLAATVLQHRRVTYDASGNIVYAGVDTTGIGTLIDNGVSGNKKTVKTWTHPGTFKMICGAAIGLLARVYAAAEGKVSATPSGPCLGIALTAGSGDLAEIEVLPDVSISTGVLYNTLADSATVHTTTVETDFNQSITIPANGLKAGDIIDIEGSFFVTSVNGTPTVNIKLYIGSVVLIATGAVAVVADGVGYFKATAIIRASGAAGSVAAMGETGVGVAGTATMKPFNTAPQTLDTTAAAAVKASVTWSASHASNIVNLENLIVSKR